MLDSTVLCTDGPGSGCAPRAAASPGILTTLARALWPVHRRPAALADERDAPPGTLKALRIGERGRVQGYAEGGRAYRRKLLSMGLTPGVAFEVLRVAPLGDPVEVRVRGSNLSLRRDEAAALRVERLA